MTKSEVLPRAIIQNSEGEVLLLLRSKNDDVRPGQWDFPGGGVDAGEDYKTACAREILEETGLSVGPDELELFYAGPVFDEARKINRVRLLYLARVSSTNIKLSSEHEEYQWLPPEKAVQIFTHPFWGVGLKYAIDNHLIQVIPRAAKH